MSGAEVAQALIERVNGDDLAVANGVGKPMGMNDRGKRVSNGW